jgi:hypothetical protein
LTGHQRLIRPRWCEKSLGDWFRIGGRAGRLIVEKQDYYRISEEADASQNAPHPQPAEPRLSQPSPDLVPSATQKQSGNLSLRRLLFEDDGGLARAVRTFFPAIVAAHQSVSPAELPTPRNRLDRTWAKFYQHIGSLHRRGSAILAARKTRFHPLKSLSQRATNSYAAAGLAIVVLFFVFLEFAGGRGIAGNAARNHNLISKESSSSESAANDAPTTVSGLPGGPELGPLIAEQRSNLDYAFASNLNRATPTALLERREDAAMSANPPKSGTAATAAGSQSLFVSGGGGGGPSGVAPTGKGAAVSVPETGTSFWLLGLAFALTSLTRQLLRRRAQRRT